MGYRPKIIEIIIIKKVRKISMGKDNSITPNLVLKALTTGEMLA